MRIKINILLGKPLIFRDLDLKYNERIQAD